VKIIREMNSGALSRIAIAATVGLLLSEAFVSTGAVAQNNLTATVNSSPTVASPVAKTPQLSELASSQANLNALAAGRKPIEQRRHRLPNGGLTSAPDRATLNTLRKFDGPTVGTRNVSAAPRSPASAPSIKGFVGITDGTDASLGFELEPPDQGLAVNNNVAVEINNNAVMVFDATTGATLAGPIDTSVFFNAPDGTFLSDTQAFFDPTTQRWFLTEIISDFSSIEYIALAVSETSSATGSYYIYHLRAFSNDLPGCGTDDCLPDYPKAGYDANIFIIDVDLFNSDPFGGYVGAAGYAIPKSVAAAGGSFTYTRLFFGANDFVVQPSIPAPGQAFVSAANGTEYLMEAVGSNSIRVWAISNTNNIVSNPSSLRGNAITISSEDFVGITVPSTEPNVVGPYCSSVGATSAPSLDGGYSAFQATVQMANGNLYGALAYAAKDGNGLDRNNIAWFVLTPSVDSNGIPSASISTQGYLAATDGYSLSYPAFALNNTGAGYMGITQTNQSSSVAGGYPSASIIQFTGTGFTGGFIVTGQGFTSDDGFSGCQGPGAADVGRWGDYGAAVVDAVTGYFYTANEMIPDPSQYPRGSFANWGTFITQIAPGGSPTLQVTPATNMVTAGNQGGPFAPLSFQYQLSASTGSIHYLITGLPPWLTASSTDDTVSAPTTVTFMVNTNANSLAVGTYGPFTITFTNADTGQGTQTRTATLTVNPPTLQVTPTTNIAASGTQGGLFSPLSFSYTLSATYGSVNYSISGVPPWLTLTPPSSTSGVVTSSGTTLTFTVNANANSLTPGTYVNSIGFNNTDSGQGNTTRVATLTVNAQPVLQVTTAANIAAAGYPGGPFTPSSFQYQLSASTGSINYSISGVPPWLTLTPPSSTSGVVTSSGTTVTFTVNTNANSLAPGTYGPTTITFTNSDTGQGTQTRTATLTVNAPVLQVTPTTNIVAAGNQGALPLSSFQYQLSANAGTVNYSISGVPPWLTPSSTTGNVSSSGTAVTFTVNASANSLASGTYGPTTVTFTNTDSGQGTQSRTAILTVNPAGPALQVSPSTDIFASGTQGGTFSPSSFSYTLKATSGSLSYSIANVPSWLTASSKSGTVTTTAKTITFRISSTARNLMPNTYSSTIGFKNTTNNQGSTTRTATLMVNPKQFTVSVSASPTGDGTVSGGGKFPGGTSDTVTATPNGGHTFTNWTQNFRVVSTSAVYTFTVNANVTLVAHFR
jgi:hypothetical protein